jgi:hypothetical protein
MSHRITIPIDANGVADPGEEIDYVIPKASRPCMMRFSSTPIT